jgi:hypothetical protein
LPLTTRIACGFRAALLAVLFGSLPVAAEPWLGPGNLQVRHDLQVLADAGIVRTPITAWPVSWPDVARDVQAASVSGAREPLVEAALARIGRLARQAAVPGFSGLGYAAGGITENRGLRDFADIPRENGELAFGGQWLGERVAGAVRVTAVAEPRDGQRFRLDGSYVGVNLGNFMISFGAMPRWWGPGWDGSLILSDNARPMPGITVERNYSDASPWPVLRWFGPWRASLAVAQAEGSDVAVADVRFLAARLTFKPRPWLEFGLSRTAQWCGSGRPCDADTFLDLLVGRDNRDASLTVDDEPGNQLAGYDFRVRLPGRLASTALYGQFIGEDESGGLPSKFLGQVGLETTFAGGEASWRVRTEYADTTCIFTRSDPQFDCAYRNGLYPQGYTFRGRVLGHTLDGDGRTLSLSVLHVRPSGWSLVGTLRHSELNRGGFVDPVHTLSPAGPADLDSMDVQARGGWLQGSLELGVGYDRFAPAARRASGARAFVRYSRGF